MASDPNDEKAKRVKNLLSLYYAQGDAGGGGAEARKVTAIDSAAFDAEAYVANLASRLLIAFLGIGHLHVHRHFYFRRLPTNLLNLFHSYYYGCKNE